MAVLSAGDFEAAALYIRSHRAAVQLARMIREGEASCRHVHPASGSCDECGERAIANALRIAAENRQRLTQLLKRSS